MIGLYWDQGESDGKDAADAYEANLNHFIDVVRRDTGIPKLPFFIRKHIFRWPNIDTIIAAQQEIAAKDPNSHLIDIGLGSLEKNYEAWSYSPGNPHLSSKAFLALTKRLFEGPLKDSSVESFPRYRVAGTKSPSAEGDSPIAIESQPQSVPTFAIDWPAFLARHDMLWKRLPGNWREPAMDRQRDARLDVLAGRRRPAAAGLPRRCAGASAHDTGHQRLHSRAAADRVVLPEAHWQAERLCISLCLSTTRKCPARSRPPWVRRRSAIHPQ